MSDPDHGSQVMNRLEGSPPQEHLRDMDVAMHPGMPGQPFGFNNVPQSHLSNPHVQFDRNNALNAYKQVQNIGPLGGFNGSNVNFHHDMSLQRTKPHDGYGSEDDDYGQSPGKRKLDDVMQRQQHSNREKKRRNEMNEAIETLKLLLPQSDKNRFRVTKVSVLNEAIEYIQRIKDLCMTLAKDKRELHDDNNRLHQQLASLGKEVGEPRRWDDRNLMETLQSSVNIPNPQNSLREAPFSPNGRLDYQNDFPHMRFENQQGPGFPFGMGGPIGHPGMPPHLGGPFHPGMPMMGHPQIRIPGRGGPMPPHMGGMDFNPMAYPFFPGRMEHNPNFQDFRQFQQRDGQDGLDPQFQGQHFPQENQQDHQDQQDQQLNQEHIQEQHLQQEQDQQQHDHSNNNNNNNNNNNQDQQLHQQEQQQEQQQQQQQEQQHEQHHEQLQEQDQQQQQQQHHEQQQETVGPSVGVNNDSDGHIIQQQQQQVPENSLNQEPVTQNFS